MTDTERLAAVRAALFPEPEQRKSGHYVCSDAAENIDAAIYDLKRTKADAGCIKTLERIAGQLEAAKRVVSTELK